MIYIFGDSFGHPVRLPWAWTNLIGQELNQQVYNYCVSGSGLEFTFYEYESRKNLFTENDIVIIILTQETREFLFKDRPDITTPYHPDLNKSEQTAYEGYRKYLHNSRLMKIHTLNFFHHVQFMTEKKNLHTIVLNAFDNYFIPNLMNKDRFNNIHISIGSLFDSVSMPEFASVEISKKAFKSNVFDVRANHLVNENHRVLADKIISNIVNGDQINLLDGFYLGIIDEEKYKELLLQQSKYITDFYPCSSKVEQSIDNR